MVELSTRQLFERYSGAMALVESEDDEGTVAVGSAFHVGAGIFVTAAHVVSNRNVTRLVAENLGEIVAEEILIYKETSDVAGIRSPSVPLAAVPLGTNWDDVMNDEAFYLVPVLLMGYPPVPMSREPRPVAVSGEVEAVIDRYDAKHPHFVVSPLPRGGFSGGPVIVGWDFCLGVVSQELRTGTLEEPGFTAVLSIEPVWNLLDQYGIRLPGYPDESGTYTSSP
jgi:hypothetical protein